MSVRIDNIVLSDDMKQRIAFFQDEQNGETFLDRLDELLDKTIEADTDNYMKKCDDIAVIREVYKLINGIHKAAKEDGLWEK